MKRLTRPRPLHALDKKVQNKEDPLGNPDIHPECFKLGNNRPRQKTTVSGAGTQLGTRFGRALVSG